MNGLIEWFAKNGVAANLLAIFIAIVGVMTIGTLRQEVFPEFSSDIISVSVVYPGAAPEEVEEGVSQKIEEAIYGLTDVKKITSSSQENAGLVMVELNPGTDAARALDEIKTRIDAIDTFPEEAEKPLIEEIIMRKQVINVAVSGEATEKTLRHYASKVRDQLMALDGITQVELANVRDMEISIEISEDTLRRYGITFDEVAMAIRKSSVDLPGGSIKVKDSGEVLLRTKGQAKEVLDFEQIVLRTLPDGTRLRLGQVANLIDGFEENDRESYFDGERCALVKVFRVGDENAIEISDIVKQYITESAHLFPEGIALETWQDDSFYLAGRRDLMIRNGVTGFCLVFMVLALFLRFRLAFWVSLGIPISFLGTFWLMPGLDVSISMISLFAFIVVLGIVVDDAILIGENIHAHHERGTPGLKGSVAGAIEMAKPVTFAVATSIAAFAPLIFVEGNTGKIMKFIPLIVIPTLFFSLIESLFILPKNISHLRRVDNHEDGGLSRCLAPVPKPVRHKDGSIRPSNLQTQPALVSRVALPDHGHRHSHVHDHNGTRRRWACAVHVFPTGRGRQRGRRCHHAAWYDYGRNQAGREEAGTGCHRGARRTRCQKREHCRYNPPHARVNGWSAVHDGSSRSGGSASSI